MIYSNLFNVFMRFNTADLDRIPCRFIKERWGQNTNGQNKQLTHIPIRGKTDILRRLRNVEAKTQVAKSQNTNGQNPNSLHMTLIHGEADILRRLRNVEARTQMAKSQNTNGQNKTVYTWRQQLFHPSNQTRILINSLSIFIIFL